MKKYLSGLFTGLLVTGFITTALAASGTVSFNKSPIAFNGQIISAAGEGYTLSNGCVAPASITYTDEKEGGTTYLPARRVAELMGVDIGWDPATGAVTVTGDTAPAAPEPVVTPAPDTTAKGDDWSAEDEAAYQEFKGMWNVECVYEEHENKDDLSFTYEARPKNYKDIESYWANVNTDKVSEYMIRWLNDLFNERIDYPNYGIALTLCSGTPRKDYVAFTTIRGILGMPAEPLVHKTPYRP